MKDKRALRDEIERPLAQFATDSMVLTETYVDSAIRGQQVSDNDSLRLAAGIVNSVIFGLLFWLLILLMVVVARLLF